MITGNDARMVAVGLVKHVNGERHITQLEAGAEVGAPTLMEMVHLATDEVPRALPTHYTLRGKEAVTDQVFDGFRKAGVLDHPARPNDNMMAPPHSDVKEGQSALVAQVFNDNGPVEYSFVFDTANPPASIKDALKALDELVTKAHAQGPDPTDGAAVIGGF